MLRDTLLKQDGRRNRLWKNDAKMGNREAGRARVVDLGQAVRPYSVQ